MQIKALASSGSVIKHMHESATSLGGSVEIAIAQRILNPALWRETGHDLNFAQPYALALEGGSA